MGAWPGLKLGQNLATPLLWEVWEWQGIAGAQFQKDAGVPENQNRLYTSIKKMTIFPDQLSSMEKYCYTLQ